MSIIFKDISKTYSGYQVLEKFNLKLPLNRISCLLGPSGIGKTTLLNILAGSALPDEGEILSPFAPGEISYLFQKSLLLPWMTVQENISYLMPDNFAEDRKKAEVNGFIQMMELDGFASHYPAELSGGMSRRVALARALARPAPLLIMDEPFVALDPKLKVKMIDVVRANIENQRRTAVIVTHDLEMAKQMRACIFIAEKDGNGTLTVRSKLANESA
jgi:NitT/TauT family transport system ATP-binding protein